MPVHLDERAKKEWKRLCPILERMRVLTEADGIALANLCFDVSTLQQAQEALTKTGLLAKSSRSGIIHLSPLVTLVGSTTDRVLRSLREFGMTSASRSRVQAAPEDTRMNAIEAALCGGAPMRADRPIFASKSGAPIQDPKPN
jgi:P27 family predicted phage terminase small subunit